MPSFSKTTNGLFISKSRESSSCLSFSGHRQLRMRSHVLFRAGGGSRNLKPQIWKTCVLPLELHRHKCNLMANHRLLVATNQCFSLGKTSKSAGSYQLKLCLHLRVTGLKVLNLFYQFVINLPPS